MNSFNVNVVAQNQIDVTKEIFSRLSDIRDRLVSRHGNEMTNDQMKKIIFIGTLNDKAIELLDGSLTLLCSNNLNASQTLMRPFIDNVTTQFYLGLIEDNIDNYVKKLEYETPNQDNRKQDDKIEKKIKDNYRLRRMINKLYSNDNHKAMITALNLHNSIVHPDPRVDHKKIASPMLIQSLVGQLPSYSIINILARVQSYRNTKYEHPVFLELNNFFSSLLQIIGSKFNIYVPNHPDIVDNLMFAEFLNLNKKRK